MKGLLTASITACAMLISLGMTVCLSGSSFPRSWKSGPMGGARFGLAGSTSPPNGSCASDAIFHSSRAVSCSNSRPFKSMQVLSWLTTLTCDPMSWMAMARLFVVELKSPAARHQHCAPPRVAGPACDVARPYFANKPQMLWMHSFLRLSLRLWSLTQICPPEPYAAFTDTCLPPLTR